MPGICIRGALVRSKGPKFQAEGQERERGSWRGSETPPHQLGFWRNTVKLPQWGSAW